jgi:uncharacterized protein
MKDTALFEKIAGAILYNGTYAEEKKYIQHGRISVYEHSFDVAKLCFSMGEFFRIADKESLVRAALLHDFFLYDWHRPERVLSLHGWMHPVYAAENGRKYFNISDKEYSCIRTHMWPWTLFHPPLCREGWIICLADKACSLAETVCRWRMPK